MILAHLFAPVLLAALRAHGAWGVAYPPADVAEARPALVYLHGMWASPEDSCPMFEAAAQPYGFLVCPRGNAPLGDGRMWAGTYGSVLPQLRGALKAAEALAPGKLSGHDGTLLGYSNGAYFAAEIALHEPGAWTSLVLLSMHLELDAAKLGAAGIHRVVLGAGDKDMAAASMKALAAKLDADGLPTRYVSLGPGGHELPRDMSERMGEVVQWVRSTPSP